MYFMLSYFTQGYVCLKGDSPICDCEHLITESTPGCTHLEIYVTGIVVLGKTLVCVLLDDTCGKPAWLLTADVCFRAAEIDSDCLHVFVCLQVHLQRLMCLCGSPNALFVRRLNPSHCIASLRTRGVTIPVISGSD